jgi:hypothetical protein
MSGRWPRSTFLRCHGNLPGAVCLRCPVAWATACGALPGDRTPQPGVDYAAAARGVSLGAGTQIPGARSRSDLRSRLFRHDQRHGDGRSKERAPSALAESLRGAADRFHSPRMFGPCDGVESSILASNSAQLFCLLSPIENASLAGEGLARAARDSAARNGIRSGLATGRRTAPPLRTTGRLRPTLLNGCVDRKFQHDPLRPRS